MMDRTDVSIRTEDGLNEICYRFLLDGQFNGKLYEYLEMSRKTTRHKFVVNRKWGGIDNRHSSMEKPKITQDIIDRLYTTINEKLKSRLQKLLE